MILGLTLSIVEFNLLTDSDSCLLVLSNSLFDSLSCLFVLSNSLFDSLSCLFVLSNSLLEFSNETITLFLSATTDSYSFICCSNLFLSLRSYVLNHSIKYLLTISLTFNPNSGLIHIPTCAINLG